MACIAALRYPPVSVRVFKQRTQLQTSGLQGLRRWKHVQYSFKHWERTQLQAVSPGAGLLTDAAPPGLVKARGLRAKIAWIAYNLRLEC